VTIIHRKLTNPPGTPIEKVRCEYCKVLLVFDNRSVISMTKICLKWWIYQMCIACRKRYKGKNSDATLMKRAYIIAGYRAAKSKAAKLAFWNKKRKQMKKLHPDHKHLPGLE